MKLVRFGSPGRESPGLLVDGVRRDASGAFRDWDREFFETGGVERLAALLALGELPAVPEQERWGAPVARPGKVVCVGLNYVDHAREAGAALPAEPVLFLKAPNAVVGPYDAVRIPRGSTKTDYEVELAVVIGRPARYLASPDAARAHVAGYCISNDVSERAFQLERGGQWTKGKSCDTFNPLGPFLATSDEIPDPQVLSLTLDVNGERRQDGNTHAMAWGVDRLVWYVSQFMALEGGDVVSTGTPAGVGMGRKPPAYLAPGDVCELEITGLGKQRQVFERE
ncbi:MAG TPA: fumarylacetoacetate hydrolase family protein [Polyangiaceae bacterium]|nr:fumarylacetoacetate hydrolase family protein [Polyangiaceae bacterium]